MIDLITMEEKEAQNGPDWKGIRVEAWGRAPAFLAVLAWHVSQAPAPWVNHQLLMVATNSTSNPETLKQRGGKALVQVSERSGARLQTWLDSTSITVAKGPQGLTGWCEPTSVLGVGMEAAPSPEQG